MMVSASKSGFLRRRRRVAPLSESNIDYDGFSEMDKEYRLTLPEEVLLLGLKDQEGYTSFLNDSISQGLRACVLVELALRKKIALKDSGIKKERLEFRLVEAIDSTICGDAILDEALRYISKEDAEETVDSWIELLSGETWNPFRLGLQIHNVRERISKNLVEKGILSTERKQFYLFHVTIHPVNEMQVKQDLVKKVQSILLHRWQNDFTRMRPRELALIILAHISDVLENALSDLSDSEYNLAMKHLNQILDSDYSLESYRGKGVNEMVFSCLDSFGAPFQ